jgi:hypothetical protein
VDASVTPGQSVTYYLSRPPQKFDRIANGTSNVILLADAYANCDRVSRVALTVSPTTTYTGYTFGIDWNGNAWSWNPPPNGTLPVMFQSQPCLGSGPTCCNNYTVQSGHKSLNVALVDGSVRPLQQGMSLQTFFNAMQPNSNLRLADDW